MKFLRAPLNQVVSYARATLTSNVDANPAKRSQVVDFYEYLN
jgi:hypothetical protein